ncbi:hypothetical protein ID866_2395 [Astraeus odoratus]|nr:hypothetical protein ID866_2395 [Astraeus odoratus]
MPTVPVDKADLFERLGKQYTTEEFDKLCFEYGLELDEDTTEEVEQAIKNGLPAERPYKLIYPPGGEQNLITMHIHPETQRVRPLIACAILRNLRFTPRSYASFIDLQEKLHQNIGRRRSLVSIGTHDLDTIEGPFRYEARDPEKIKFKPLTKTEEYTARELMTLYESDKHLSRFLPIIRDSPVYPIIYDSRDRVLSFPPIINSEHSKITLNTRNVFIEVTATDDTKLQIVINIVTAMFSEYCEQPYNIEPVKLVLPDGSTRISPDIAMRTMTARTSYINSCTNLSLAPSAIAQLLTRMALSPTLKPSLTANAGYEDEIIVSIPCTRPDIFHECDIMEDASIAYGFNNLPDIFPQTSTIAQPLPISRLVDVIRREWAMAGWVEALPLILCSHEENFALMNRPDPGTLAVKIANPKTLEFQVVRTSLLPGLLKTIRENRSHALPIRLFELSDVVFKDTTREKQARNERHAAALWCSKTAGFEVVHGLLDRAMRMLEIPRIASTDHTSELGYYIVEGNDPAYFSGRAADIYFRPRPVSKSASKLAGLVNEVKGTLVPNSSRDIKIGTLGVLHPTVLSNFEITYPCSALEFNIEVFLKKS